MPALATAARFSQSPLKYAASPPPKPIRQPLTFLPERLTTSSIRRSAIFMPTRIWSRSSSLRLSRLNGLPVSTPILARSARIASSFCIGGKNCIHEGHVVEELRLREVVVDLGEVDGRRRRRGGLVEESRERARLVAVLDLDHVVHVGGIEELGAENRQRVLRTRLEHLLESSWCIAPKIRADDHVVARFVAGRSRADVAVVVGAAVDELHRVVALGVDR